MKVYPSTHLTFKESQDRVEFEKDIEPEIPSNEQLVRYYTLYFESYRTTLENFFPSLAHYLTTYQQYPYRTTIIWWGPQIFLTVHQPSVDASVEFRNYDELGLETANLFDLKALFDPCIAEFDFTKTRMYDETDAQIRGKARALDDVLQLFWLSIGNNEEFTTICLDLVDAETFSYLESKTTEGISSDIDLKLEILIAEPAGFKRIENWGFIFRHFKDERITAELLLQVEDLVNKRNSEFDTICLVTSGDITSIGRSIVIGNNKIRVWDRHVLNQLVNRHLVSIKNYLESYKIAVETIGPELEKLRYTRFTEFKNKLNSCPTGKANFANYEQICLEILEYVFDGKLKFDSGQSATKDRTQRRDFLGKNLRNSQFFQRIFDRFGADFVIFDAKNNGQQITKREIDNIAKYPSKALGKLAILISRQGSRKSALDTQIRYFNQDGRILLSISDENLLEMILRKEQGEEPEDLLEDLLDDFLKKV